MLLKLNNFKFWFAVIFCIVIFNFLYFFHDDLKDIQLSQLSSTFVSHLSSSPTSASNVPPILAPTPVNSFSPPSLSELSSVATTSFPEISFDEFDNLIPPGFTSSSPIPEANGLSLSSSTNGHLPFPDDYTTSPHDNARCEALYGGGYLRHIATHHVPYCDEALSRSSLECFRTNATDPVCIGRGLTFDPARPTRSPPQSPFNFHCQLRNFTREKIDAQDTEDLEGVKDVADMGSYFFSTGAGEQINFWDIRINETEDVEFCNADTADSKFTLLVKRELNNNIWHKLMELWQSMITLDALQMALNPETNEAYLPPAKLSEVQIVFEDVEPGPLDEWWPMLTGRKPVRLHHMEKTCFSNVILPLAGSSSPFWNWKDDLRGCKDTFLLDAFLNRLYRYLRIEPSPRLDENITITIIDRKSYRKLWNMQSMVEDLKVHLPDTIITVVDLVELSLLEQVTLMQKTDILVGLHGAGLTHVLFLPEGASVAEIRPAGLPPVGLFRNLAKMRGLLFLSALGETREEWEARNGDSGNKEFEVKGATWQSSEWAYMHEDVFRELVLAAVHSQSQQGVRHYDVKPVKVSRSN